jgi:hypothetical protein
MLACTHGCQLVGASQASATPPDFCKINQYFETSKEIGIKY